MIGKLSGTLLEKSPPQVLIDCGGVGYEVDVPMSTFYGLPHLGEKVALLTHFVVREDAQLLYGFATATEREAFRQLIKVSGVGPRMALSLLSGMSVAELAQAMQDRLEQDELDAYVLMLTDLAKGGSLLYFASKGILPEQPTHLAGAVSRKKEGLPWLTRQLS